MRSMKWALPRKETQRTVADIFGNTLHPEEVSDRMFSHMSFDGRHEELYAVLGRLWDAINKSRAAETAFGKAMSKMMYDEASLKFSKHNCSISVCCNPLEASIACFFLPLT